MWSYMPPPPIPQMFCQLPSLANRQKYNKLHNVCQQIVAFVDGMGPSVSVRYLNTISKLWLPWPWLQQHATLLHHSQAAQPCWSTHVFNLLCKSPVQTYVLVFKCLPHIHIQLKIPKIYTCPTWYFSLSAPLLPLPWVTVSRHCQC